MCDWELYQESALSRPLRMCDLGPGWLPCQRWSCTPGIKRSYHFDGEGGALQSKDTMPNVIALAGNLDLSADLVDLSADLVDLSGSWNSWQCFLCSSCSYERQSLSHGKKNTRIFLILGFSQLRVTFGLTIHFCVGLLLLAFWITPRLRKPKFTLTRYQRPWFYRRPSWSSAHHSFSSPAFLW